LGCKRSRKRAAQLNAVGLLYTTLKGLCALDRDPTDKSDSSKTNIENESSIRLPGKTVLLIRSAWILVSLIGVTLGGLFIGTWFENSSDSFLQLFALLVFSGAANGMLQIVILRFDIRKSIQWILINGVSWLAGGIGYVLALYIFFIVFEVTVGDFISNFRVVYSIIPLTAGLAVGSVAISSIEQVVLFKWYGFDHQWNRVSIVGSVVAGLVWLVIAFLAPGSKIETWITGGCIAGIIKGVFTGKPVVQLIDYIKRI
jgi:hypothetical protein